MDDVSSLLRYGREQWEQKPFFGEFSVGAAEMTTPQSLFFIPPVDENGCIPHAFLMGSTGPFLILVSFITTFILGCCWSPRHLSPFSSSSYSSSSSSSRLLPSYISNLTISVCPIHSRVKGHSIAAVYHGYLVPPLDV